VAVAPDAEKTAGNGQRAPMAITVAGLTKNYGEIEAVRGIDFEVPTGETFGFLGPNGAGKSTTIKILCTLARPTSGTARVAGHDVTTERDRVRRNIGLVFQDTTLDNYLTGAQNLRFHAELYGVPAAAVAPRMQQVMEMVGLWDRRDAPARTFSKGMRQRLAIARALIHDPPVLFLDEPTANLDPEGARTVRDFLLELRRERRTILLSTHLLDEADRICDRVGVLHTRLLAAGPPSELRAGRPGHVTRVQLAELTDAVVTAARAVAAGPVEVTSGATSSATGGPAGGTVAVPVGDPGRDNPALVAAIVAAGGRIRFVTEATTSLEEAYLTLLGGAGSTEPRVTQLEGTQLEGTKPGGPQ